MPPSRITLHIARSALGLALATMLGLAPPARADEATALPRWSIGASLGAGRVLNRASDPLAGDHTGLYWTLEADQRLSQHWALGVEVGANRVESFFGCGGNACVATSQDLARGKEFDHAFLVTRLQPAAGPWSLRAGAGLAQYCYGQDTSAQCHTLSAPGFMAGIGYDWRVRGVRVGLQAGIETASFPARPRDSIGAFHYVAVSTALHVATP